MLFSTSKICSACCSPEVACIVSANGFSGSCEPFFTVTSMMMPGLLGYADTDGVYAAGFPTVIDTPSSHVNVEPNFFVSDEGDAAGALADGALDDVAAGSAGGGVSELASGDDELSELVTPNPAHAVSRGRDKAATTAATDLDMSGLPSEQPMVSGS